MTVLALTTVVRGSSKGQSHGGLYLVDIDGGRGAQLLDWTRPTIDWSGYGAGRGLRGLAVHEQHVYVAGSDELFCFDPGFHLQNVYRSPYLGGAQAVAYFDGRVYVVSRQFDALLSLNIAGGRFDWGLQISDDEGGLRGMPFDPQGTVGPSPGSHLRLNSLHCDSRGLFVSGSRTAGLLHFDGRRITRLVTLPERVHDARPWRDGVLFNDTGAGAVRFLTPQANRVFQVPRYPEEVLEPGSFENPECALQGYARGLCVIDGQRFASGSSPLTVTVHDLEAMKTELSITLETDARHAVHTLAAWPFAT
ncbi:MAG: hypothetical protein RQ826_07185 [Xanthomonadales bacterium]|nr:hypothetical protein [Xanthomonadales bacterium]